MHLMKSLIRHCNVYVYRKAVISDTAVDIETLRDGPVQRVILQRVLRVLLPTKLDEILSTINESVINELFCCASSPTIQPQQRSVFDEIYT